MTTDATAKCQYCGSAAHPLGRCPAIAAIEYFPDGTVKRVELVRHKPDERSLFEQVFGR